MTDAVTWQALNIQPYHGTLATMWHIEVTQHVTDASIAWCWLSQFDHKQPRCMFEKILQGLKLTKVDKPHSCAQAWILVGEDAFKASGFSKNMIHQPFFKTPEGLIMLTTNLQELMTQPIVKKKFWHNWQQMIQCLQNNM